MLHHCDSDILYVLRPNHGNELTGLELELALVCY